MTSPADWYLAAEARWQHMPAGEAREVRVRETFEQIKAEAQAISVRLPELDSKERANLLEEAVLDIWHRHGMPLSDLEEELFHARVDDLFARMCIVAREQKAPPEVRGRLIQRRLARRWAA